MFNENPQDKQVELFSDYSLEPKKARKSIFNLPRVSLSLSYENIIIISIGLIICIIACFSLGVEKGKQLVKLPAADIKITQKEVKTAIEPVPQAELKEKPKASPYQSKEKRLKIKLAEVQVQAQGSSYIQVASYLSDKYAEREMQRLKSRGYQAFANIRGKYRVVCVGRYQDQDAAKEALIELKKLYADCILRRN